MHRVILAVLMLIWPSALIGQLSAVSDTVIGVARGQTEPLSLAFVYVVEPGPRVVRVEMILPDSTLLRSISTFCLGAFSSCGNDGMLANVVPDSNAQANDTLHFGFLATISSRATGTVFQLPAKVLRVDGSYSEDTLQLAVTKPPISQSRYIVFAALTLLVSLAVLRARQRDQSRSPNVP